MKLLREDVLVVKFALYFLLPMLILSIAACFEEIIYVSLALE
jgi:hypothetical protein